MRNKVFISLILAIVFYVYSPVLSIFFSQDDFNHLYISRVGSLADVVNFFKPQSEAIFYRPLSIQIGTSLTRLFFGLNPSGFHLVSMIFHLLNVFFVFILIKKLFNQRVALLTAFFYGLNSSHFLSVFWISEFSILAGSFFFLLSLISYTSFLQQQNKFHYYLTIIFQTAGYLSSELTLTLPFFFFLIHVQQNKKLKPKSFVPLALLVIYISLRLIFIKTHFTLYQPQYQLIPVLLNLKWYLIRTFGLPEAIKTLPQQNLILGLWLLFITIVTTGLVNINKPKLLKLVIFTVWWFLFSLPTFIFLTTHASAMYLNIALISTSLIFAYSVIRIPFGIVGMVFSIIVFFLLNLISINNLQQTSWLTRRARLGQINMNYLLKTYPHPQKNTLFYFRNTSPQSSSELYLAFGGEKAIQIVYNDFSLQALYEDFHGQPTETEVLITIPVLIPK